MRKTFCEVNLKNLKSNIEKIISTHNDYSYYFGVVKADCYGHGDLSSIQHIIDGGCNYLAVATMKEALFIRDNYKDIPILFLGCVNYDDIGLCNEKNITISVCNLEHAKMIREYTDKYNCSNLKCHIKINTGMNRLGISKENEFLEVFDLVSNICIEGIYSHIYDASNEEVYLKQLGIFENIVKKINYSDMIIHLSASDALINYSKPDFINGCRLGIIMYGFNDKIKLDSTFRVVSEVIQINTLNKGDTLGYNGMYQASSDNEKIAVVPIGYADGIIRKNTGRYVYINNKKYNIVGNICMDMLFVKVDDSVNVYDQVELLRDIEHINYVSEYLDTIPYEVMCTISKRVERVYIL